MKTILFLINFIILSFSITNAQTKCGDTLIDARDGKKYGTVKIGSQCWMKDNLNVGTMVTSSTVQSNNSIIEKYCYNDGAGDCNTYGGLYQWNEAMNYTTASGGQGICPNGWHLPTNSEWQALQNTVGINSVSKLIVSGSSGFDGEYSGVFNGTTKLFEGQSNFSLFWTSSIDGSITYPFRRGLYNSFTEVYTGSGNVSTSPDYGYCVRCVSNTLITKNDTAQANIAVNKVYPVPAIDELFIETQGTGDGYSFEIIDIYGGVMKSGTFNDKINSINIKDIKSGVYLLKIINSNNTIEFKKIKIN